MERFGGLAWGQRTGGRLGTLERMSMSLEGAVAIVRSKLGFGGKDAQAFEGAAARVPTTALARRADALLLESSPPWLVNHGRRTYVWASALAERDGLRPDAELLYCASALHDLGLVGAFQPDPGGCFAISGARGAEEALREAGMSPDRARRVAEAIALHLNVVVGLASHGPEAHLLRAATALDVAGQDVARLSRAFREATLAEIPRLAFKDEVIRAITAQARRSPHTRIGFLCDGLGLCARVRSAPFPS